MTTKTHKSIWKRFSAVLVAQIFILTSIVAMPITQVSAKTTDLISPDSISVSSHNGSIYKTYQAPGATKLVVHIQDAHCNPGVQNNIASILTDLNSNINLQLIGVEGNTGWVNTAMLNAIPAERRKGFIQGLVEKAVINGPAEFAGNQEEINAALYGIEDRQLYINNIKAYGDIAKIRTDAMGQITIVKDALTELEPKVLNKDLLSFVQTKNSYNDNLLSFGEYVNSLAQTAGAQKLSLANYPNIDIISKSYTMEDEIDFEAVDTERTELIDSLTASLPKEQLEELISKSLQFRTGKLDAVDYYNYLINLLPRENNYSNLVKYTEYIRINADLDKSGLAQEKTSLETAIQTALSKTPQEKELISLMDNLAVTEKMFKIKLTRDEFNTYKNSLIAPQTYLTFIKSNEDKLGTSFSWDKINTNAWTECKDTALSFYNSALKRESAFVDNLLTQMDRDNSNISALITGGFHTDKIEELLASRGISYVVIRPRVTERSPEGLYGSIMSNMVNKLSLNTLAPEVDSAELVTAMIADDEIAAADEAAARALLARQGETLRALTTIDAVLAALKTNVAQFQAFIAQKVTPEAAEAVKATADKLREAVQAAHPDIQIVDTMAIGRYIHGTEPRAILSNSFVDFFAALVDSGAITRDEAAGYLSTVVAQHEMDHKAEPSAEEAVIVRLELNNLVALEQRHNGVLAKLRGIYNNSLPSAVTDKLAALGVSYQPDMAYADFINFANRVASGEELEETAYTAAVNNLVQASIADALAIELQPLTDAVANEAAVDLLVVDVQGLGEARAEAVEGIGPVILSKKALGQIPFSSVVAQPRISSADVSQAVARAANNNSVGSYGAKDGIRVDVTKHADETGNRLVITRTENEDTENVKQAVALAGDILAQLDITKLPDVLVQQYELAQIQSMDPAQRQGFLAMLNAVREASRGRIHYQFLAASGQVVEVGDEEAELKSLQTTSSDEALRKEKTVIRAIYPTTENKQDAEPGVYYLPVNTLYSAIPALVTSVAANTDVLNNGSLDTLDPLTKQLLNMVYDLNQIEAAGLAQTLKNMFQNPWNLGELINTILRTIPIESVNWNAVDLMRRMIAVNA